MDSTYKPFQKFNRQKYNIIIILILLSLSWTIPIQAQTFLHFNNDSITAIDIAQNQSIPHFSTDSTATFNE